MNKTTNQIYGKTVTPAVKDKDRSTPLDSTKEPEELLRMEQKKEGMQQQRELSFSIWKVCSA